MSAREAEGPLSLGALQGTGQTPSWPGGVPDGAHRVDAVNRGYSLTSDPTADAGRSRAERGAKRGRVHFHLLGDVGRDIRTGVDVEAVQRGDYRTASVGMREEYVWLRHMAQRYGFGFVADIQPVKSCEQAIAKYLSKYVAKHIGKRELRDKGTRLVGVSMTLFTLPSRQMHVTSTGSSSSSNSAKSASSCAASHATVR